VTLGETPHGGHLYPVFPYTSYSRMTVEDALAIKAHLATLAPVQTERQEHDLSFPFSWRELMKAWKLLFFAGAEPLPNEPSRDATWNRGRYLVDALGHCGECHTPRGMFGQADNDRYLRGNAQGPDGWKVPAVAGDTAEIHAWSTDEIAEYLKTGTKPDFDNAQGPMAEVIEDGTSYLTDEDRRAVAYYLQSLGRKQP
jgi:mono/diheme cytochrome c family protein